MATNTKIIIKRRAPDKVREIQAMLSEGLKGNQILDRGYSREDFGKAWKLHESTEADEVDIEYDDLVSQDAKGLAQALRRIKVDVRYNERLRQIEYLIEGEDIESPRWAAPDDRTEAIIRQAVQKHCKFPTKTETRPAKFSDTDWNQCINALCYGKSADPFKEWLEELPAWDGERRLDTWIAQLFEVDNEELASWVSRFIFAGAVKRTYQPGFKLDEMPVIVGAQGVGKSTLVRLALPDRPEWFSDGLMLSGDDKARVEACSGRVIIEASEMAGSTRADLERLKAFITRQDDGNVRLAYRRNPEPSPRMFIIVGTSNDNQCLPNDASGNRRFVPITISEKEGVTALREYLRSNRSQLWAEALASKADNPRLPDSLRKAQLQATEGYRFADVSIEDALDSIKKINGRTLIEIAKSAGIVDNEASTISKPLQTRIGKALSLQGWTVHQNRKDGIRARRYYHPDAEEKLQF